MKSVVSFLKTEVNPSDPEVVDVLPQEVEAQKDNLWLVDVRSPQEYTGELGHIPNAQLYTLDELPQRLGELPKDQPVVFICRSGGRSASATRLAREKGFSLVYNLKGGMLLWNELGLKTEPQ